MSERGTAAVFVGTGRPFELREYPLLPPEPGAILARVRMANVCGSDLHMWRGELDLERLKLPMPLVLGHEAVGEVVALGEGVTHDAAGRALAPGDRISWRYFSPCGSCPACRSGMTRACQDNHRFISRGHSSEEAPHFFGAFATHHVMPPGQVVVRVPDSVSDANAAAANCALAQVIQAFQVAGLRSADTVVIQGAGGLGIHAAAVASVGEAARIVVLDQVAARLDLAREFGADVAIDVSKMEWRERVRAVQEATGGRGADLACEFVGHASAMREGLHMLAPAGRYLAIGTVNTGSSFELDPAYLTLRNRSILGCVYYEPWALREALAFLDRTRHRFPWGRLGSAAYPLREIDRAFRDADERKVPRASLLMDDPGLRKG